MSEDAVGLRRTLASAGDLQSVVRTMKALAASSIGQYEQSVRALAGYNRAVELALSACLRAGGDVNASAPLSPGSQPRATVAVVFGSDQGLVGQFNQSMADFAVAQLSALTVPATVWVVGERVFARLRDADMGPVRGPLPVPLSVKGITALVGRILLETEAVQSAQGLFDLRIFHHRPKAGSVHAPVSQRLLPLDADWRRERVAVRWPTQQLPQVIHPGRTTMRLLIREYLFVSLFRACAESLASENASRLSAMERADKNISELLDELQSRYNRQRQSGIDAELFDMVAGFEALTKPRRGPHAGKAGA